MRSQQEVRLECLKLASSLAQGKVIRPEEVQARAEAYFKWILAEHETQPSVQQMDALKSRYAR